VRKPRQVTQGSKRYKTLIGHEEQLMLVQVWSNHLSKHKLKLKEYSTDLKYALLIRKSPLCEKPCAREDGDSVKRILKS
jgi:hypothetical protein